MNNINIYLKITSHVSIQCLRHVCKIYHISNLAARWPHQISSSGQLYATKKSLHFLLVNVAQFTCTVQPEVQCRVTQLVVKTVSCATITNVPLLSNGEKYIFHAKADIFGKKQQQTTMNVMIGWEVTLIRKIFKSRTFFTHTQILHTFNFAPFLCELYIKKSCCTLQCFAHL